MNRRDLFTLAPLAGAAVALAALPAQASEGGGGPPKDSYIRFPTLTATIIRPDGRRGVMTVETGIDVPNPELRERAVLQTPRLRAAYNTVIQQLANGLRPGEPPDVERLSHELQVATFGVLRRGGATLLLGTVMIA